MKIVLNELGLALLLGLVGAVSFGLARVTASAKTDGPEERTAQGGGGGGGGGRRHSFGEKIFIVRNFLGARGRFFFVVVCASSLTIPNFCLTINWYCSQINWDT